MPSTFDVIVLAGGLGTRLRQAVPDRPKPLAPVHGRPFLDYLLAHLAHVGVGRVILSIGYMGDLIQAHYGQNFMGMSLAYAPEDEPLGTGGAIKHALALSHTETTLVLNGDTLLHMDPRPFVAACQRQDKPLGIVTRWVDDTARYGRCVADQGTVVRFGEKDAGGPGYINGGIYSIHRDLFKPYETPARFSFETDFIASHLASLKPLGYPTDAYFIDIGVPDDFLRAQAELPALALIT